VGYLLYDIQSPFLFHRVFWDVPEQYGSRSLYGTTLTSAQAKLALLRRCASTSDQVIHLVDIDRKLAFQNQNMDNDVSMCSWKHHPPDERSHCGKCFELAVRKRAYVSAFEVAFLRIQCSGTQCPGRDKD
jgi:hypothetical protein